MTLPTVNILGVEILETGTHNGYTITTANLDQIVSAFDALKGKLDPPVKLGHADDQRLLQEDGYPAAGWVSAVKRVGQKLVADLGNVPKKIGELIAAEAYRKRSVEVYFNWTFEGRKFPCVLTALALLGGDLPAVKTLDDIKAMYADQGLALTEVGAVAVIHLADWSTAYINGLPDSSFALIQSGGSKDAEGRTTPRALRFLPYKDTDGKVDLPHLRNALARLGQSSLQPDERAKASAVLVKAAKAAGVGEYAAQEEGIVMDELLKQLRQALGLSEEADQEAVVKALTAKVGEAAKVKELSEQVATLTAKLEEAAKGKGEGDNPPKNDDPPKPDAEQVKQMRDLNEQVGKLTTTLAQRDADAAVAGAIKDGKLLPAQKEWADKYALSDLAGFQSYVEGAPVLVKLGVGGTSATGKVDLSELEPTAEEKAIAVNMGVWSEEHRIGLIRQNAAAKGVELPATFGQKSPPKE